MVRRPAEDLPAPARARVPAGRAGRSSCSTSGAAPAPSSSTSSASARSAPSTRTPSAVAFCHQRGRNEVALVPPGAPLPFADDAFDLVTTLDVIEHIDDDVAALRELRRVLRPGGRLLVAVPAFMFLWGKQDEVSHHRRRYTAASLARRARRRGVRRRPHELLQHAALPAGRGGAARAAAPAPARRRPERLRARPGRAEPRARRGLRRRGGLVARRDLPFGVSLLALATKP